MSNSIVIDGKKFTVKGNNITVSGNSIIVDGVLVTDGLSGIVKVQFEGDLAELHSDCSVSCQDIKGDVTAGGSISCNNIQGSANAGGSINCNTIMEKAIAGGSINYKQKNSVCGSINARKNIQIGDITYRK